MKRSALSRSSFRRFRVCVATVVMLVGAVAVLPAMGQQTTTGIGANETLDPISDSMEKLGTVHFPISSSKEAQAELFKDIWTEGELRDAAGTTLHSGDGYFYNADENNTFGYFKVGGNDYTKITTKAVETVRNG